MSNHNHQHSSKPLEERLCAIDCTLEEIEKVLGFILRRSEQIMGDLQGLTDTIVAEHAEVQAKLDVLAAEIQALKDAQAGGTLVTPAQFDELIAKVQGISEADF